MANNTSIGKEAVEPVMVVDVAVHVGSAHRLIQVPQYDPLHSS